jgi:hypothetical protein
MEDKLTRDDWDLLLDRIKDGKCTPFLGAGACHGVLPLGSSIAEDWAQRLNYPLDDCTDLARVAQFLAVNFDAMRPKELMIKQLKDVQPPDFADPNETHRILADLPLPIYITTNYDDFMFRALKSRNKRPVQEVCRWNNRLRNILKKEPTVLKSGSHSQVNEKSPVVFHLHGHIGLQESIVLTEDDYLDFLVNVSRDEDILPARIQEAMAGTSLLFLGYRLNDWNFRVLFRSLVGYLERSITRAHVSVQLVPVKEGASDEQKQKAQEYLHRYFGDLKIRVYWGTCQDFAQELKSRWEEYDGK